MLDARILVDNEELDRYEQAVTAYLNLEMDADRFMTTRLMQGVYGQRQEGLHMVRIKLPGGELTADQLDMIAAITENYAEQKIAHVTTRQDFQVHYIPVAQTPQALRDLARVGLTSREACNNTVRNITMNTLSGLCPGELVDITPFKDAAAAYFLRHPLTQQLPRKFKMSFSGCETDPAQGMLHDLGIVATRQGGRFGFKLLAGGGLGHKPFEAITVMEFLEEKDLLPAMEAIISLHHKHSDRTKRAKSRIKFLVGKFGAEGFIERFHEEFARTRETFQGKPYPTGEWVKHPGTCVCGTGAPRTVLPQKQIGLHIVPVSLPIGDMTPAQMHGVARLMQDNGLTMLRATQDQNIILIDVPTDRIETIRLGVEALGLGLPQAGDNVVACPGTSTCRLGITASRQVAPKLSGGVADLSIKVSGCQNGCAQPEMADIGIYGQGKRLHGKLIPHYQMYFGGDGRTGYGLALKGPEVPVARIEPAIARVQEQFLATGEHGETFYQWSRRMGVDYFKGLLQDLIAVSAEELQDVLRDYGDEGDFKVLQLGGGECSGAAQNIVSSSFLEAAYERTCRNALIYQRQYDGVIDCNAAITRLVTESLLYVHGVKKPQEGGVLAQLAEKAPDFAARIEDVETQLAALQAAFSAGDLTALNGRVDKLMDDAAHEAMRLDPLLDLSLALTEKVATAAFAEAEVVLLPGDTPEARNLAAEKLSKLTAGDELHLRLAEAAAADSIAAHLQAAGHTILGIEQDSDGHLVKLRKETAREAESA